MAITLADFNKIWASTSPLTPYSFSEANYKQGWNFIGATPPARQMWDFIQKQNDEKMQYIVNNYVPTNVPLSSMNNVTELTNEHDLDNIISVGTYIWNSNTYYPANIPTGVYYARMFVFKVQGTGYTTQLIYPHDESKGIWYRVKVGGSGIWTAWKHFAFAEDVLPLSGGNITGSLTVGNKAVELVNEFNSSYIRYESGLQICWGTGSTSGGIHQYTFPAAFSDYPNVSLTASSAENSTGYFCKMADLTTTGVKALTMKADSTYIQLRTYYIAVGYWK